MKLTDLIEWLSSDEALPAFEKINATVEKIVGLSKLMVEGFEVLNDWWKSEYPKICEAIANLNALGYTKEEKQVLIKNYKKWGAHAWSSNAENPATFFSEAPGTLENADSKMRTYCTESNIAAMKDKLIAVGVNRDDVEEAFCCHKSGFYKSCVLILFALIDHELISKGYRRIKDDGTQGTLKSGMGAIGDLKKESLQEHSNSVLFAYLQCVNIMSTLTALFGGDADFKKEPKTVNRNYVSHGMSTRKVTELDSFKVWSALFSFVVILPMLSKGHSSTNSTDGCSLPN